jgi:hypothetical protein
MVFNMTLTTNLLFYIFSHDAICVMDIFFLKQICSFSYDRFKMIKTPLVKLKMV